MGNFRDWLLVEARGDIEAMGFPSVISRVLYERYGRRAVLVARWFRDWCLGDHLDSADASWFRMHFLYGHRGGMSLSSLCELYDATWESSEAYIRRAAQEGITLDLAKVDDDYLFKMRCRLLDEIRDELFEQTGFFTRYRIMRDLTSGVLKDVAPYRRLRFLEAEDRYERRVLFKDKEPLVEYPNGYRWVDVGPKSTLVGRMMRNCGSSGLMGLDSDRTILCLFGPSQAPHALVVYHPNEKRISHEEGVGSSALKSEYHPYVLDLVRRLGVSFDVDRSKSMELALKYRTGVDSSPHPDFASDSDCSYRRFQSGGVWYVTDGDVAVSEADVARVGRELASGGLRVYWGADHPVKAALASSNREIMMRAGVRFLRLDSWSHGV